MGMLQNFSKKDYLEQSFKMRDKGKYCLWQRFHILEHSISKEQSQSIVLFKWNMQTCNDTVIWLYNCSVEISNINFCHINLAKEIFRNCRSTPVWHNLNLFSIQNWYFKQRGVFFLLSKIAIKKMKHISRIWGLRFSIKLIDIK